MNRLNEKRELIMADDLKETPGFEPEERAITDKVKFEVYGEEMIEKIVKSSGNSGRIYLPPDWIGHTVKIVKVD